MKEKNTINLTVYSKKIVLILFIVVLPLILLSLFFIKFNKTSTRFYFNKNGDKPIYLYQSDIAKKKEFNKYFKEFNLEVVDSFKYEDKDNIYPKGKLTIEKNFIPQSYYKDSYFSFRWVLAADYMDAQSQVSSVSITETKSKSTIIYPFNLPNRKYLLFKVNRPNLYIEIKISNTPLNSEDVILYYKIDLNNLDY
jgi:hypothetical protein